MGLDRMIKARTGLVIAYPFFGTLAFRLELVEDPKVKTTAVDGRRLAFNPAWSDVTPMPELEAAFAHQVLTCALGHHLRRGTRDRAIWNDASDHAVNQELKQAGFSLPAGALLDPRFSGLHTEAIYAALEAEKPQDGGGQGDGQGQGQSSPKGDPGQSQPGGKGEEATGTVEDARDEGGQGADEAEKAQQAVDWQEAVAQASQVARGCGKLPGGIERAIQEFLNPKVDWREALPRLLTAKAKEDYSWSRPNRRYMSQGIYLPSLDSIKAGVLALAVDISGSISQATVDQFVAEIEEIRAVMKPEELVVMMFDTQVRKTYCFGSDDLISIKAMGGGGTAFDHPVRLLAEEGVVPDFLVYLTDLCSSAFPPEPEYPVVWVSTMKGKAPFGDVILM
jgi:predicted metal-dependent peptidase